MPAGVLDPDLPAHERRTIVPKLDGRLLGPGLLRATVQASEVHGAGRTPLHDLGNLIRRAVVDHDPRLPPGVEHPGKPSQALRDVAAKCWLPGHLDPVVPVDTLHGRFVPRFLAEPLGCLLRRVRHQPRYPFDRLLVAGLAWSGCTPADRRAISTRRWSRAPPERGSSRTRVGDRGPFLYGGVSPKPGDGRAATAQSDWLGFPVALPILEWHRVWGQDALELDPRSDAQLGEHLAQVVLDRAGLMNRRAPISGFESPSRARRARSGQAVFGSEVPLTARAGSS
jgi:hypothetical protein